MEWSAHKMTRKEWEKCERENCTCFHFPLCDTDNIRFVDCICECVLLVVNYDLSCVLSDICNVAAEKTFYSMINAQFQMKSKFLNVRHNENLRCTFTLKRWVFSKREAKKKSQQTRKNRNRRWCYWAWLSICIQCKWSSRSKCMKSSFISSAVCQSVFFIQHFVLLNFHIIFFRCCFYFLFFVGHCAFFRFERKRIIFCFFFPFRHLSHSLCRVHTAHTHTRF